MRHLSSLLVLPFVLACTTSSPPPPAEPGRAGTSSAGSSSPDLDADSSFPPQKASGAAGQPSGRSEGEGGAESEPIDSDAMAGSPFPWTDSALGGSSGQDHPTAVPARLAIVAYVESPTSFNAVLIENASGGTLGVCWVEVYRDGSTSPSRPVPVHFGLTRGARTLLCLPEGTSPACTGSLRGAAYDGNDAVVLRCNGRVQDTVGVVGVDPGSGWSGTGSDGQPVRTVDQGIWRCGGVATPPEAFDPADWVSWNWQDDPTWLGPTCPEPELGAAGAPGE